MLNFAFSLDVTYILFRYYQEKAGEDREGSIREPSLILCWFIVGVVTVYVIFLGFQGTVPSIVKDEL